MKMQRWWLTRRIRQDRYRLLFEAKRHRAPITGRNMYMLYQSAHAGGTPLYIGTANWDRLAERVLVQSLREPHLVLVGYHGQLYPDLPPNVPAICEWLICLAVEPEFQEDRLADYQERFTDLWVPKFGPRVAVLLYAWHVLRQARFIDWIIRLLSNGSP